MKYNWLDCPGCHCQVAVNYSETPQGISGSLRRWAAERGINDGRALRVPAAELPAAGGFATTCVCGQPLSIPGKADAVSAEREGDLRVDLGNL
jgi:hypothetical protein